MQSNLIKSIDFWINIWLDSLYINELNKIFLYLVL